MKPEYSRHSIEVPPSAWQQEFDRLHRWSAEVYYGQISYADTYDRQLHLFPVNIVHTQRSLFRHIHDELTMASSFLTRSFYTDDGSHSQEVEVEKQTEDENEKSSTEKTETEKKIEVGEGSEDKSANGERNLEGDAQYETLNCTNLGREKTTVLESHFQSIAKTITCLTLTAELTGSRARPEFSELQEELTERFAYPNCHGLPREEVRQELSKEVELLLEKLERSEKFNEQVAISIYMLKDQMLQNLATPSTEADQSDDTNEMAQTDLDETTAGDTDEGSPREEQCMLPLLCEMCALGLQSVDENFY